MVLRTIFGKRNKSLSININGVLYGNHFSIGKKDVNSKTKRQLIDIHYTVQDPNIMQSVNNMSKCWLYDGKQIDTSTIFNDLCEIPKNKTLSNVYNDLFINYIIIILSSPFTQGISANTNEIKALCKRLTPPTSPK